MSSDWTRIRIQCTTFAKRDVEMGLTIKQSMQKCVTDLPELALDAKFKTVYPAVYATFIKRKEMIDSYIGMGEPLEQ